MLVIPQRNLDDKFKLADFQGDFSHLYELFSKPTKIHFHNNSGRIVVTNRGGRVVNYIVEYNGSNIAKITNTTDDVVTVIERG